MKLFQKEKKTNNIKAVVTGKTVPIETVDDEVFSTCMMGPGIAIEPEGSIICAPGCGKVISANEDMAHAIGLQLDSGIELLIHIGIDTVKLPQNAFKMMVKESKKVKTGTPLIKFDQKIIQESGYDNTVMVVLMNTNKYNIQFFTGQNVEMGVDDIIAIS